MRDATVLVMGKRSVKVKNRFRKSMKRIEGNVLGSIPAGLWSVIEVKRLL